MFARHSRCLGIPVLWKCVSSRHFLRTSTSVKLRLFLLLLMARIHCWGSEIPDGGFATWRLVLIDKNTFRTRLHIV